MNKNKHLTQTFNMFKKIITLAVTAVCFTAAILMILYFQNEPIAPRVGNFIYCTSSVDLLIKREAILKNTNKNICPKPL